MVGVLEEALSSIRGTGAPSGTATAEPPSKGLDLGQILHSIRFDNKPPIKGKTRSELYPNEDESILKPPNTFPIIANDRVAQALQAIRARLPAAKEAAATAMETPMIPGGDQIPGIPGTTLGKATQVTMAGLSLPFEAVKQAVVTPLSKAAKALGIEDAPLYGVGPIPGYKDMTVRQGIEVIGEGTSLYFTPKAIEAIPKIAEKILFETVK